MVNIQGKPPEMDDDWGYPYFSKTPYIYIYLSKFKTYALRRYVVRGYGGGGTGVRCLGYGGTCRGYGGYGGGVRWVRWRGAVGNGGVRWVRWMGAVGTAGTVGTVGTVGKWARWTVGAVEGGYRRMVEK